MIKNPFKKIVRQLPHFMQNRYMLVLILFLAWLTFFDKNNFFVQRSLQKSIEKLEQDKQYYLLQRDQVRKDRMELEADKEKFAREHYYMHKNNEEVFIIEEN